MLKMKILFLLFIQVIIANTVSATEVISGPNNTYSLLGDNVTLKCTVNDHTSGLVNWYRIKPRDANEGGGVFCSIESDLDEFSCFTTSHYDNFELNIINDTTYDYQYNIQITGVEEDDLGEYACYAGSAPSSGSVLCEAVDTTNIYVEFNGTKYNTSSNIGTLERQSYALNAIAENSKPEITFDWTFSKITDFGPIFEDISYNYTNNGSCGYFTSIGNSQLNLNEIDSDSEFEFAIMLKAINEITENIIIIYLNGTFEAGTAATNIISTLSTTPDDGNPSSDGCCEWWEWLLVGLAAIVLISVLSCIVTCLCGAWCVAKCACCCCDALCCCCPSS